LAAKAHKGELHFPLPVGLVFDDDKIALDPDQEVQGAVRTVFELFERESSAYAVVQRFQGLGLRFPRRSYGGAWNGKLFWGRLMFIRSETQCASTMSKPGLRSASRQMTRIADLEDLDHLRLAAPRGVGRYDIRCCVRR